MVTRVDKKPIIYNTCLLRVLRPSVVCQRKEIVNLVLSRAVGHAIPDVPAHEIVDDYEQIDYCLKTFGINDPDFYYEPDFMSEEEIEAVNIARSMVRKEVSVRRTLKDQATMEFASLIQANILKQSERIYFGTEAVYALMCAVRNRAVVKHFPRPSNKKWLLETAENILELQAPYMLMHPISVARMAEKISKDMDGFTWEEWGKYKCIETLALRLTSRRNLLAHANLYGINKKEFEPSEDPAEDFKVPINREYEPREGVSVYILMGIKYICVNGSCYCLSNDDCINLASMAQCFYRHAMYFLPSNGYHGGKFYRAVGILSEILDHCVTLINCKKNFANCLRALHILAQGDFNDAYEERLGEDLGWRERSVNYINEANSLDKAAMYIHRKVMDLARNEMDKLNIGFVYHCFVGDEMLIGDLKDKVQAMPSKVLPCNEVEWAKFIRFSKTYFLARFMLVNKRKPRVGGNVTMLNEQWADKCLKGVFKMPREEDWGKVWIEKEFSYTKHADTWHLDAQDVSYVPKDTKGIIEGKYTGDRLVHSELLMAMTSGNILDQLTGSTPTSARERIRKSVPCTEVAVTTAPKAENAKPSWKKRVTFAADCEFRKLQAEYDRNCRKCMSFVRGPSLGVNQKILEGQFSDICKATLAGMSGGICSHDISAWSESMDRDRKFEFESVLLDMLDHHGMDNIKLDWGRIHAVVNKQGSKLVLPLTNGSFQGFDGSASTILHSMILLYCIDSARRKNIMPKEVKANMATLIDDCIALMDGLTNVDVANSFWKHLKDTYMALGFEVDDLKSIFSTIKAIYLSRRFLCGAEVPSDYKVFVKAHVSYEDPLRCAVDSPSDIFGALRGSADANGNAWFIYYCACLSALSEISYFTPQVSEIPPAGAAVFALAPFTENGWGMPSIIDWCTNDVLDKRAHFNAILENAANHATAGPLYTLNGRYPVYKKHTGIAVGAIKSQAWRIVSVSNIFTNPFDALREGPLKPDMLKRNAVQDMLREVATAEPWVSLLKWNVSQTTERVRQLLISSGPLHAPTLSALVNCMPDNYRLSLVGKATGSQSLLELLPKGRRSNLRRRVARCSNNYFLYSVNCYKSSCFEYQPSDFASLSYTERTNIEREEFYTANGVVMTDHTFPDPVGTYGHASRPTGAFIAPNISHLIEWDRITLAKESPKDFMSPKGIYVPRTSARVWEITSEYAKGWDTVSQRIAMGLAVIARAKADGHETDGLLLYFIKSWNEVSNITPEDTHLISIHGSIKRLDSNPGSSTHPVICHRNFLRGIIVNLGNATDAIPAALSQADDNDKNLHDPLAGETGMLAAAALHTACLIINGHYDTTLRFNIIARNNCIVAESKLKMKTDSCAERIAIEIMDGEDNYGLLQSCPELAAQIAIPTMKASWVDMINALLDEDYAKCEELRKSAETTQLEDLLADLESAESYYSTSVVVAAEPAKRRSEVFSDRTKYAMVPSVREPNTPGDAYTIGVQPTQAKFTRAITQEQPDYISSAVSIRSVCWDRLKSLSFMSLAAIYYEDPDADLSILKECANKKFWVGIITEVQKHKAKKRLSELVMQGFRSLGVSGIHLRASDSPHDIAHAVASYFGANLNLVVRLISDQVLSIAGRSAVDYERPFLQRVVTNNPTLRNISLRKEHLWNLIKYNKEQLESRISLLKKGIPKHRGDKKACTVSKSSRLIELNSRKLIYDSMTVNERGEAILDNHKFQRNCELCYSTIANEAQVIPHALPTAPDSVDELDKYLDYFLEAFIKANKAELWDTDAAIIGVRLALDTVLSDSQQVSKTKYAVSPSEIAPMLHKRLVLVPSTSTLPKKSNEEADDENIAASNSDDESEYIGLSTDDEGKYADFFSSSKDDDYWLIEPWKMLFTLLYIGDYTPTYVNEKLGLGLPVQKSLSAIRGSKLDQLDPATIMKAFDSLAGDYLLCGTYYDEDWLIRDEEDAYTTDEVSVDKHPARYSAA